MKNTKLITDLKYDMARFLNLSPEDYNLSFEDYFGIARQRSGRHSDFCERYASGVAKIASLIPPEKQNIIFGVLTNGEIFVEVNGQQHSPDEAFYKMAAIQSSTLAHQVRDLEQALQDQRKVIEELKKNALTLEAKRFIYCLEECVPSFKGYEIKSVFSYAMSFEP